jgi:hypothetical protein
MENKERRLEDLPKRDPFTAPEGYFSTFGQRIVARIDQRKNTRVVSFSYRRLSMAAAVAGILCLAWFGYRMTITTKQTSDVLLAEISIEDLHTYLESEEVDTEDLLALAGDDAFAPAEERIDDVIESLDDAEMVNLYDEFEIIKDDTL